MKEQRKVEEEETNDGFGYKPPPKSKAPPKKAVRNEDKPINSEQTKKSKWKAQSEAFRSAMKASSGNDTGPTLGKGGIPIPAPEVYDDRTECQFCGRKFNETAAERHIPQCEVKFKSNQMKGGAVKKPFGGVGPNTTAKRTTQGPFRK
jgi:hypothetical protein